MSQELSSDTVTVTGMQRTEASGPADPLEPVSFPGLYHWPPQPLAALQWLGSVLFPWGLIYIGLAVLTWIFLTPAMDRMADLSIDWIFLLWLRNACILAMVAGGLHWWLYVKRGQGDRYKIDSRWPRPGRQYLGGRQTLDNMFWSLISGVTFWTFYESLTFWYYASGRIDIVTWAESPVYLMVMCLAVFFWSTTHFYFIHRLMHLPSLFRHTHALHHRNLNPIPWSGISMHPYEHAVYFTLYLLWWVVPVHPVIIILTGFFQTLSPAVSHSGFRWISLGRWGKMPAGDLFHHLHHRQFDVNYGNITTPIDYLAGTWHDGSPAAHARFAKPGRRR